MSTPQTTYSPLGAWMFGWTMAAFGAGLGFGFHDLIVRWLS